jgi:hypothetical protein
MATGEKRPAKRLLNKELPVFAFFLLLSFVFWYLNELGKELEGTINYPVRYINPPKDLIITGTLPDKMEMDLRGPGYSILKMKLSGSRAPVVIDFSREAPKRIPGPAPQYLLVTSGLIQSFSKQLHADFEIISIQPDTLFFGYDRLVTRRKAVLPDLQFEGLAGSRVIIVLDTLQGIRTRHRTFSRLEGNFSVKVPLAFPDYIQTTQKRVTIEVTLLERHSSFFSLKNHQGSQLLRR